MENTTDEATTTPTTELAVVADHIENSTDATRGEPLATRAQKRRVELQAAADKLAAKEPARRNLELAIASFDDLLAGDTTKLSHTTCEELSRLLETSKHLGETAPTADKA